MGRTKHVPTTMEGWMIKFAAKGESFYTDKPDRVISAGASYNKRKVKTERLIVISGSQIKPIATTTTRVTLLDDPSTPNENSTVGV